MPKVKSNDLMVAIRMLEFCRPPTAWNRALWSVATTSTLQELLEAASVRREGILSDSSMLDLQATASILVGRDPGVGDGPARKLLQFYLSPKTVITPCSLAAAHVEIAIKEVERRYLLRWADFVQNGVSGGCLEQCARCAVSFLLSRHLSPEHIARSIRRLVFSGSSRIDNASDLLRELDTLASLELRTFRAVFPAKSAPLVQTTASEGWMRGAEVVQWMRYNQVKRPDDASRFTGAVSLDVEARDHFAAAEKAIAAFELVNNRAILGTGRCIQPVGYFWLSGTKDSFAITRVNRGVEVASIGRQDQVYGVNAGAAKIDRAIALLAELDHGPLSAAVTSGWAAMESLAMGPAEDGNRVETAVRVASLVAASFPRAELTTLAYSYIASNDDQFSHELRSCATNRERSVKMLELLELSPMLSFRRAEDSIAAKRMRQLARDTGKTLLRIKGHVGATMKRLYRVRNMVAHGGRTDSVVLEAAARTAAPLIGAAFDRIHHASISGGVTPIELIARAQLRMSNIEDGHPSQLTGLLE